MELLADENIPVLAITRLRDDGWTVHAMRDIDPGAHDDVVADLANRTNLLLVTQDRDFGEIVIARGVPIAGVVLVELERLSLQAQIERLSSCLATERALLADNFTVVEPSRVRRRKLP